MINYIKEWILNREFIQDRIALEVEVATDEVRKTAFKFARKDVEETMKEETNDKVEEMAKKKLSDALGFVDENYILTHNKEKGLIFLAGERLDPSLVANLKQEAELMASMSLWKVFNNSLGDIARKTMFEKSESFEDMRSGKMMLYNLSLMNNIIKIFRTTK
jgi:hypothetical protein